MIPNPRKVKSSGRGLYQVTMAASAAFLLSVAGVAAHQAPSGWAYGLECCSNQDCRPVEVDQVEDLGGGKWRFDGLTFEGKQVKPSQDNRFHVCIWKRSDGTRVPMCIYVLQGS